MGATLDDFARHVSGTAGSLAPSWTGEAATAYGALSAIVSAHFRGAADTSRAAAAGLARYSAELDRCQREGLTATREAERCLDEIKTQNGRMQAAQQAATMAQNALSAARAEGTMARAAGPLGAPFAAAADAQATAAQGALAGAHNDAQAASRALAQAEHELKLWQTRGRRAWEDAQSAADRATATLHGLTIAPPPLAGIAPIAPLIATAPFAIPGEQCGSAPGPGEEPGLRVDPGLTGGMLPYTIPDVPPWTESFPGREPAPADGLRADPVPDKLPSREGIPAHEPIPGENTTADPAPESCGSHILSNQNGGTNQGGVDLSGATPVSGRFPPSAAPGEVLVRRDPKTGQPTNYQEYGSDGLPTRRVDLAGPAHGAVATPHVHEYGREYKPENRRSVREPRPGAAR